MNVNMNINSTCSQSVSTKINQIASISGMKLLSLVHCIPTLSIHGRVVVLDYVQPTQTKPRIHRVRDCGERTVPGQLAGEMRQSLPNRAYGCCFGEREDGLNGGMGWEMRE